MSTPPNSKSRIDYTASGKALQTQADNAPTAALTRHREFLEKRATQIGRWVTQGVKPEALVRFALMDMDGDKGAKLRECTPQSIYLGLLACAVTGLEPGALKGEAYLVPYKNKGIMEATFMPGWRGLVKQARRSREIVAISSQVVFERDEFDLDLGTANTLIHKPALRDRGKEIVGAYAIARLAGGGLEIEWMDRDDLDGVRSAGSNGPAWTDWADQMYRKAPIRRLCKRLPLGADYYVALALDGADSTTQAKIIDVNTDGEVERAQMSRANAAEMAAQAGEPSKDEQDEILQLEREQAAR
jgi:recombination protein RecT